MGRGKFSRRSQHKRSGRKLAARDAQSMISIWDSGIEYGQYKYNTGIQSNIDLILYWFERISKQWKSSMHNKAIAFSSFDSYENKLRTNSAFPNNGRYIAFNKFVTLVYSNTFGFDSSGNKNSRNMATLEGVKIDTLQKQRFHTPVNMSGRQSYEKYFNDSCSKHNNLLHTAAPTWNEFTRSTTFHGVRYVFDHKKVPARGIRRYTLFFCKDEC